MSPPVLAEVVAIRGESLVSLLITVLIVACVFWLLSWLIAYIPVQEPFAKIARVILAVAAVLILINALLGLAGHPLVAW